MRNLPLKTSYRHTGINFLFCFNDLTPFINDFRWMETSVRNKTEDSNCVYISIENMEIACKIKFNIIFFFHI